MLIFSVFIVFHLCSLVELRFIMKQTNTCSIYQRPYSRRQSRIKVFWGLRLDTIVGPHTHPTLPSSSDPINLTGVWGITTEKVWNCKGHRRVSEAQPGQNFGGENWGQSRNLLREVPENWGQSPNRDKEGKRSGEGVQRTTPQKICKNLNLKPCRQSGAQFKQHSISFLAFIILSLNFIVFFFDERGDCGQAAEGDDLSRGGVPTGGFGE